MQRLSTIFLTGALALSLASPLHAEDVSVEFKSSSLDTQAGTQDVYHQMTRAARKACVVPGLAGSYPGTVRNCRAEVLSDLVHNSRSPALIALHADGTDRVPAATKFANAETM